MTDSDRTDLETAVTLVAHHLAYPPTPELSGRAALRIAPGREARRGTLRAGWATGIAALAVVALLLAAPPVRAALAEFLQVGVIRIFTGAPTTQAPVTVPVTPAPPPIAAAPPLALDALAGEMTLEEAQSVVPFAVRVPAALGAPDRVFAQRVGVGPVVTLAWLDPSGAPQMVLQELGPGALVWKMDPATLAETTVNGQPALWVSGPYVVALKNGDSDIRHLVIGSALLWEEGGITFRLESDLPLEEAAAIAESMPEP